VADKLYRALVTEALEERVFHLDGLEPQPDDGIHDLLPTCDRALRGQVRLLIKSLVDVARAESKNAEFSVLLWRVPWCSSRRAAARATNNLLEIAAWARERDGEDAGSRWASAAQITSWLLEDYCGYRHNDSYETLSYWYFNALPVVGWNEGNFRDLLAALEPKEA
jgi:hypothetical protein